MSSGTERKLPSGLPRCPGLDHRSGPGRLWYAYLGGLVRRLGITDPMQWESHLSQLGVLRVELDRLAGEIEQVKKQGGPGAPRAILSAQRSWRKTASMLRQTEAHLAELAGPPKPPPVEDAWRAAQPSLKKQP